MALSLDPVEILPEQYVMPACDEIRVSRAHVTQDVVATLHDLSTHDAPAPVEHPEQPLHGYRPRSESVSIAASSRDLPSWQFVC